MKIYHVPGTRSIRIIWLCHELGVPLEIETISRFDAAFKASPEWRAKSPTGKVPVLDDGAVTIYESGAMLEYILSKYGDGRLVPSDADELAYYYQWCWFAEATFARPLGDIIHHTVMKPPEERIAALVPDAEQRAGLCIDAVDEHMVNRTYLLGNEFTAADIMMGYSLMLSQRVGVMKNDHSAALSYFNTLKEREGFRVALDS